MAEASYLWDNPGTGDSPALGYGNSLLCQVIFRMLLNGTLNQGVLRLWENELEVTDGGGLNAAVDTGASLNYGVWYENTAAMNVAIGNNTTEWVVVRASWATQTARLVAIAPGAFTQTPGVTYDIPLAAVTTVAGVITLITDTRDYCEFSTSIADGVVVADNLQADSVTIGKLTDQDRWLDRGAGTFQEDATTPPTWSQVQWGSKWWFATGADEYIWCTLRVPADISGANLLVYLYDCDVFDATGDVRWTYNLFQAAAGGVLANASGAVVVSYTGGAGGDHTNIRPNYTLLLTRVVAAGDIVHLRIGREGTHITDTLAQAASLFQVKMDYTADS